MYKILFIFPSIEEGSCEKDLNHCGETISIIENSYFIGKQYSDEEMIYCLDSTM
jgi:hypothetical protein